MVSALDGSSRQTKQHFRHVILSSAAMCFKQGTVLLQFRKQPSLQVPSRDLFTKGSNTQTCRVGRRDLETKHPGGTDVFWSSTRSSGFGTSASLDMAAMASWTVRGVQIGHEEERTPKPSFPMQPWCFGRPVLYHPQETSPIHWSNYFLFWGDSEKSFSRLVLFLGVWIWSGWGGSPYRSSIPIFSDLPDVSRGIGDQPLHRMHAKIMSARAFHDIFCGTSLSAELLEFRTDTNDHSDSSALCAVWNVECCRVPCLVTMSVSFERVELLPPNHGRLTSLILPSQWITFTPLNKTRWKQVNLFSEGKLRGSVIKGSIHFQGSTRIPLF